MPKKYWVNLPEAALIPGLVHDAPSRVAEMIERARTELARPAGRVPRRGQAE
jgi:DNA polymerase